MNQLIEAFQLLTDAEGWLGPTGWGTRLAQHLYYTVIAVGIAAVIGLPIGLAVGHFGRGRSLAVLSTGVLRALPTLGLLTLVALWAGLGLTAPLVALVILAIPSILAGAYAGVESVDPRLVDAARAQGLNRWQVLWQMQIPIGLPQIIGGIRLAALQVIGTAILAAYVGAGGLGAPLFLGLSTSRYPLLLASSLLVIALAIVMDVLFDLVQRLIRRFPGIP